MINLSIENTSMLLYPGTTLTLEIENDLFNLEQLEGSYSYPFEIPINEPPNAEKFNFPEVIENVSDPFGRDYESLLEFSGAVLSRGVLKPIRVTGKRLKANLFADGSEFARRKDTLIANLVSQVWEYDPLPNAPLNLSEFYSQDSPLRFPSIIFKSPGWEILPDTTFNEGLEITYTGSPRLPLPQAKATYVLQQIVEFLGYQYIDAYSANWPDADRLTLFNNRVLPVEQLRVSGPAGSRRNLQPKKIIFREFLPDLKLTEFLALLRATTGLYLDIDSRKRTCTVRHITDILSDAAYIEMTDKAIPSPEQEGIAKGAIFTFEPYDELSEVGKGESFSFEGTVLSIADLPATGNNLLDAYLVQQENRLYVWRFNSITELEEWQRGGPDLGTLTEGEGGRNIKGFKILAEDRYIHHFASGKVVDSGGNVALELSSDRPRFANNTDTQIKILGSDKYPEEWVNCTDVLYNASTDVTTYVTDLAYTVTPEENVEIHFRYQNFYVAPQVAGGIFYPEVNVGNRATAGAFLYHHSAKWNNGADDLRMAGAGNYDGAGNKQCDLALGIRNTEGIPTTNYNKYLNDLEKGRQIKMRFRLNITDLINFRRAAKWRIRDNNFIVTGIKVSVTNTQIKTSSVTLVKVQ